MWGVYCWGSSITNIIGPMTFWILAMPGVAVLAVAIYSCSGGLAPPEPPLHRAWWLRAGGKSGSLTRPGAKKARGQPTRRRSDASPQESFHNTGPGEGAVGAAGSKTRKPADQGCG